MPIELGVLGAVVARVDGRTVDLGPARQRCVLAALLVDAGTPVPADQLVDRVWGATPPLRAAATLRTYLSRLRTALPADECAIRHDTAGYVVEVDQDAVDLHRFRRLVARARADAAAADRHYAEALRLWRGDAFAGVDADWFAELRPILHAERLAATLDHHDLRLARGEHAALLPRLLVLADGHPLDERIAGQLMLAMHGAGRQDAALERYQQIRRRLAEELGTDPGVPLRAVHQRVLAAGTARAEPTGQVPSQLPTAPPTFVGRDRELAVLDRLRDRPVTVVLGGYGGIGKTWLALHWAHRNLDAFPDGQLYVDLRGFDPAGAPVPVEAAVRTLLGALGTDPAAIPADPPAQLALYRGRTAGRRLLIVLDNARDSAHVGPLLPGGASATVLVTSRNQLSGLVTRGARAIRLDVLDDADAHRLLAGQLGEPAAPEAMAELLAHCAGLPLALGIVAARAALNPALSPATLAAELAAGRLDGLDAGEPTANLRAVFSWSYDALSAPAAQLFRLLGVHPGPDVTPRAVGALLGCPPDAARPALTELARAHLVAEHAPGRFASHDLLRAYAAELASTVDTPAARRAAVHRLLDHHLHTAHTAALLFYPHRHPIELAEPPVAGAEPVRLADRAAAGAWLTAEHPVLLASIQLAAEDGFGAHAWQLSWALSDFHDRQGHWHHLRETQELALAAARASGDLTGQAYANHGMARACGRAGRYAEAVDHSAAAIDLLTRLGDQATLARAWQGLGWVLGAQGRHAEALEHNERSLELHRATGDRHGSALALNAVGWYQSLLGRHRAAIDSCTQALELLGQLGDRYGQAGTLNSLGTAYHRLGEHATAVDHHERALELFRDVGDRSEEGATLVDLGDALAALGKDEAARNAWQRAAAVLDGLRHPAAAQARRRLEPDSP